MLQAFYEPALPVSSRRVVEHEISSFETLLCLHCIYNDRQSTFARLRGAPEQQGHKLVEICIASLQGYIATLVPPAEPNCICILLPALFVLFVACRYALYCFVVVCDSVSPPDSHSHVYIPLGCIS